MIVMKQMQQELVEVQFKKKNIRLIYMFDKEISLLK
jgi:hypothetical protein